MTKHLLLVDDEDEVRELLGEAMTVAGYRVTGVGTAAEALQLVKTDPPDLVITDLQLGETDGFYVIEQVKATNPRIPILLLTGVIMNPAEISPEISKNIAGYIPKTASLEEIIQVVKRQVG